ncbi:MAG: hypothetical protein Q8933_21365 [Bacteroidota bacterium]|nr:hypothetical protein [Bacteroidota bacterium]MDP4193079.1 hypothetical protein [Bacteroidota bacterium]MDP4197479.1 hypothetical protein [Bacteroidota bacterium]
MKTAIKEIFSRADDIQRLKYLLAKDDIDDIQAATLVVSKRLKTEFPELLINTHESRIKIKCESEQYYTIVVIRLKEEHLILEYNEFSTLDLFNAKSECDMQLVNKIKSVIFALEFYKVEEKWKEAEKFRWHQDIFKLDVIRRKL